MFTISQANGALLNDVTLVRKVLMHRLHLVEVVCTVWEVKNFVYEEREAY